MSRHPHTTTSTAAAALVAAALTGCLADDGLAPPAPDEPGTSVAALANDTNAKLFLTTAAAAGTAQEVSFSNFYRRKAFCLGDG